MGRFEKACLVVKLFSFNSCFYIIFNQSRTTTYGEFMTDLLGEDESIVLVDISYVDFKGNEKELTVTNGGDIKKIMDMPMNMKLKEIALVLLGQMKVSTL